MTIAGSAPTRRDADHAACGLETKGAGGSRIATPVVSSIMERN